jgi:pimeloyl-ACP methyl ester carboxylesterase
MFSSASKFLLLFFLITFSITSYSQSTKYPYPVQFFNLNIDEQHLLMAYMDVKPENPNGESILLFHGKNFNGFYWKDVIPALTKAGYRVIAPDQIGWGKSSKPNLKYTFEMLARNNKLLLDSLGIKKVNVIGHSMGGMLATRFCLMYPNRLSTLILEDPLGLEDYRNFVTMQPIEKVYKKNLNETYASYKKYQKTYYPVWKSKYEIYVKVQTEALKQNDFASVAWVQALTSQMIYEQPVLYEFKKIRVPVLFIVGKNDRTIPGKGLLSSAQKISHGNFPALAKNAASQIKNAKVIVLKGVGHIPHIQTTTIFNKHVIDFLND